MKVAQSAFFLTLTYSDDHLPKTEHGIQTLNKSHLSLFLKRLRHHVNRTYSSINPDAKVSQIKYRGFSICSIRYYAIGEYGSQTHRPHYHLIIFNLPLFDSVDTLPLNLFLQKSWQYGTIQVGTVTTASIQYVTNYVLKKNSYPIGSEKPFANISQGLGRNYLTDFAEYHRQSLNFSVLTDDRHRLRMPRYYRAKIFTQLENEVYSHNVQKIIELDDAQLCKQLDDKGVKHYSYFDQLREEIKLKFEAKNRKGKL